MSDSHPLRLSPAPGRVTVRWRGQVVAQSDNAVELREHVYPKVIYVPRADADMRFFERTAHATTCPYKGQASYFSLTDATARDVNAVWTYETPLPAASALKDHLAFYPDKVEISQD